MGLLEVGSLAWIYFRYSNQSPRGFVGFVFFDVQRGSCWSLLFGWHGGLSKSSPASSFFFLPSSISSGFSDSRNVGCPDLTISSSSSPESLISHLPPTPNFGAPLCLLFLKDTGLQEPRPPPLHSSPSLPGTPEGAAFCLAIFNPGAFSRGERHGP